MQKNKKCEFRSRVYTDRPDYADLPSPAKFQAIMGIVMTRHRPGNPNDADGGNDD